MNDDKSQSSNQNSQSNNNENNKKPQDSYNVFNSVNKSPGTIHNDSDDGTFKRSISSVLKENKKS
jgi:hypothetical protein